ncbi:MAG: sulfotransferase family 2 domain-containing protein [Leptolyngbyaceae bacterium]|nr:sulfotransferase family 2 domain-containing protein [Leptolyngbyaceae bacterium]
MEVKTNLNQEVIDLGHDKKVFIFLHIPKAGGTTLNGIINQQYKKTDIFRFNGINNRRCINEVEPQRRISIQLIRGHFAFGLHQYITCDSVYFTFLRDPIKREISHYHYLCRSPNLKQHSIVKKQTLKEYILSTEGNLQTRMIYGNSCTKDDPSKGVLEVAKENLEKYFTVVGIVERFDESLVVLQHSLGWKTTVYRKQNKTNIRQTKSCQITPEVLNLIQNKNSIDIELYKYANTKLDQQIEDLGDRFKDLMNTHKRINYLYQPFGYAYNAFRSLILNHLHD